MPARDWIPRLSVTRPVTVVTAFLVILVVGIIATARIPLQMMPSGFSPPFLWVWIPYQDSTPMETEARIVKPIEEQVATVPGLKRLESESRSDNASLSLEFHSSIDMDEAYNSVTDRLERAMPSLPSDVERTFIWRFDPTDEPVIWAGISVPEGVEDLHYLVTRVLQKRIERIPGVGRVDVWGVDEAVVWIDFDREALMSHGIDLVGLMERLGSDNFQLASGQVTDRGQVRYVRALARFESLEDIETWPVAPNLTLSDVAAVEYRPTATADINRIDGKEGAAIAINKESSANTVEICEEIRKAFAEVEADPRMKGFTFPIFFDQGQLIQESVDTLEESAIEGGILAVLVLILFLRQWRITVLIAATIPASLLLTVTVLYFRGDSLNLLSMLGLMLAVGMVVDNAVVVVETIFRRRQEGQDPRTAAIEGTSEVLLPITLSTLTSVVVFLPVILMSEDASFSFFMGALGLPVVFIQIGSLIITLLFTPLSTVWLGGTQIAEDSKWIRVLTERVDRGVTALLRNRVDSFIGIVAMVLLTVVVPARSVGCSDSADGNLNDFTVRFEVPPAFTYSERLETIQAFEQMVETNEARWGVRVYRTRMSASSNAGRLYVYLTDEGELPREEVLAEVEKAMPDLPGVLPEVGWSEGEAGKNASIQVRLVGEDTEVLAKLSEEARRRIKSVEGILGVHSDTESSGGDEMRLEINRDASARYGVSAAMVGRLVSFAMRGAPLPPWYQGDKEVRVFARFGLEDRSSVDQLLDFQVGSPTAQRAVPLRSLVDSEVGKGWGSINREDRRTALGLTADLSPGTEKEAAYVAVEQALAGMDWPRGYGVDRGGGWEDQQASDSARNLALLLSVVFVFLIMGVLFESFLLPLTVIMTVPMAMLGVYWGLWLSGTPFDVMAGVGMIILIGIVVNNGIVLVDVVTEQRALGVDRETALRHAVRTRLRPILMTALTAAVGVVPMALGDATFIGIPYAPLGRVILSGMIVATILTLFFVPYLYAVLDDLRAAGGRWLAYAWPRSSKRGAAPPTPVASETAPPRPS
ncbi:MAG: efflux RND transporter permease subunit [Pseudomonadota bacterium]|nr:efflux RND transporter permease subunit [Pseudomonadota bacterium]